MDAAHDLIVWNQTSGTFIEMSVVGWLRDADGGGWGGRDYSSVVAWILTYPGETNGPDGKQ